MPVYDPAGELVGVVGLDLTLDEISNNIESARFLQTGYSFLVDQDGKAIILPDQGYQDIFGRPAQTDEFAPDLRAEEAQTKSPEFAAVVDRMLQGEGGFQIIRSGGKELFVAFEPIESTGWSLGSVVAAEDVLQSIPKLQQDLRQTTQTLLLTRVLPIVAAISALLVLLGLVWTNRLVTPIQKLAQAAQRIGAGQWDSTVTASGDDEIALLGRTLNSMASQLQQSFAQLEQRVAERTQQLERRSLQLQTASEVARDVTTAQDLDSLLANAVNLISDRFGFYNVGIFLVDESGEIAILKAASGELGARLLSQNIHLKVGQQGIVGYVTRFGQSRIAIDVKADSFYQADPLLAETRSEVALPLRAGGRIIGALDVQSAYEAAFDQDEVTVLQTLADQLAIAIENLRLVARMQTALQEISLLYQQQVEEAWSRPEKFSQAVGRQAAGHTAYEYDRLEVRPLNGPAEPGTVELASAGQGSTLVVPIKLREQVIGQIGLESADPTHQWTKDEIAIVEATADHAAQTLENARLLAESQRKAARERLAGEVTSRMRASMDVEGVLKTAVDEIYKALRLDNLVIQLAPAEELPADRHRTAEPRPAEEPE
jgi:GAF domain-containing protein/HAMP domain-containing protein